MIATDANVETHTVVSREEWLKTRKAHLEKEKELSRLRDELYRERRALPWVKVEKEYLFNGPDGTETLSDLFGKNSQLITYHFMFGPGWKEGCPGCSFISDHIDSVNLHLAHHDVTLLAVSRAPWPEYQAFKKRMGWCFKWVSSAGSDFNYDYHVSFTPEQLEQGDVYYNYEKSNLKHDELHGISVFYKDANGDVFHTYSSYARGGDILIGVHNFLDLTPKGRNETSTMSWMRHHDKYEGSKEKKASCCE